MTNKKGYFAAYYPLLFCELVNLYFLYFLSHNSTLSLSLLHDDGNISILEEVSYFSVQFHLHLDIFLTTFRKEQNSTISRTNNSSGSNISAKKRGRASPFLLGTHLGNNNGR